MRNYKKEWESRSTVVKVSMYKNYNSCTSKYSITIMTRFAVHQTTQQTDLPHLSAHDLTKWTYSSTVHCPKQMHNDLRIWRGLKEPRQAPEGDEWCTRPYLLVHER
jgi:hypothetical protein